MSAFTALGRNPRSVGDPERLREICAPTNRLKKLPAVSGTRPASTSIETSLKCSRAIAEAKHLDPRINIGAGLEAIRRAFRRPDLKPAPRRRTQRQTLCHSRRDLAVISAFDAMQVIENAS